MDAGTISCGDELVATVSVKDRKLNITYGDSWGAWAKFTDDVALKDIVKKAQEKLSQAASKGKSKGKGKPGNTE